LFNDWVRDVRIIGIDPGTYRTGYGIIDESGGKMKTVAFGCIECTDKVVSQRYLEIYDQIIAIIKEFQPDQCAIESAFFFKNPKVLMRLGEIRGALILSAAQGGLEIFEYSPLEVKKSVTGYGKADKSQVHKMVKMILAIDKIDGANDVSDALALAICHVHNKKSFKLKIIKTI